MLQCPTALAEATVYYEPKSNYGSSKVLERTIGV